MEVRVDLAQIMISDLHPNQLIILRERNGGRTLPIMIGTREADVIDLRIKGVKPQRPLTHDLLASVIQAMNGEVEKIVVNDLRDRTFYAKLVIRHNGALLEVDSRPSDAIALGAANDAPIYVEDFVFNEAKMGT